MNLAIAICFLFSGIVFGIHAAKKKRALAWAAAVMFLLASGLNAHIHFRPTRPQLDFYNLSSQALDVAIEGSRAPAVRVEPRGFVAFRFDAGGTLLVTDASGTRTSHLLPTGGNESRFHAVATRGKEGALAVSIGTGDKPPPDK